MSILKVPNAHLYYETRGSGPVLLLIPGANGDARVFPPLAEQLSQHYTVVTYDRRGFSRSVLDGPQDYAHKLDTDADDARQLIEHLSDQPATVFGTSSGAVVALQLLTNHPNTVNTIVPYEPAAMRLLPNTQHWLNFYDELYDLYRQHGPAPALTRFRERSFTDSDRAVMNHATNPQNGPHIIANATYWFERELRKYIRVQLDFNSLTRHAHQIIPAVGRDSRGYPAYQAGIHLGKALNRPVVELPGGHAGYAQDPPKVATELITALNQLS
jgi:pimeloyl-ACP methyl ester carboxylesterase